MRCCVGRTWVSGRGPAVGSALWSLRAAGAWHARFGRGGSVRAAGAGASRLRRPGAQRKVCSTVGLIGAGCMNALGNPGHAWVPSVTCWARARRYGA